MKILKIFIFLAAILYINQIYSQELQLSSNKSILNWTGKAAFSSYSLSGTIKPKKGILKIENNKVLELSITIDMKSLNHENNDLKTHLKNKDFFEVKKYQEAKFELIKPSKITRNTATLIGNMTIKDITNQETLLVNFDENYKSISFEIILDRTKYGVKFNSPSFFKKLKENAIADQFKLIGFLFFE